MIDCYWSLYNTAGGERIDGLRSAQVKNLVAVFARSSVAEWLIWQEGTQTWRELKDVVAEFQVQTGLMNMPPTPPPTGELELDYGTQEIDKRLNHRFRHKFKVKIYSGYDVLQSETVDISLGGLKLKDSLQIDSSHMMSMVLVNGQHELKLQTRPVKISHSMRSDRFIFESCDNYEILRRWIVSGPGQSMPTKA